MDHHMPIHLHATLFHAMIHHSGEEFWGPRTEAALEQAVRNWLRADNVSNVSNVSNASSAAAAPIRGYQWKQLFLPEGTLLRTTQASQTHYAKVEGEHLLHAGHTLSPSQFANLQGSNRRNAWQVIWLRRPGDAGWQRAQDCRVAQLPVFGN